MASEGFRKPGGLRKFLLKTSSAFSGPLRLRRVVENGVLPGASLCSYTIGR